MLLLGFAYDRKYKEDFSFWLYLFGLMAFWGGLTSMHSDEPWRKTVYAVINVLLGFFGVYVQRKVFLVFGTTGIMGYLGYLSYEIFREAVFFPVVLAFIGLGVILSAAYLQRHRKALDSFLNQYRPARLRL
jgi:CHASE2 domain-containing sensor protein